MRTEQDVISNLTDGEDRWLQLWSLHASVLDQKASIIVTLDGILLALTASFLGTVLSRSLPIIPSALLATSTIMVLVSAGACTRVVWPRFFSSEMIAQVGGITEAYPHLLRSRSLKNRDLKIAIATLLVALASYTATILALLFQT